MRLTDDQWPKDVLADLPECDLEVKRGTEAISRKS